MERVTGQGAGGWARDRDRVRKSANFIITWLVKTFAAQWVWPIVCRTQNSLLASRVPSSSSAKRERERSIKKYLKDTLNYAVVVVVCCCQHLFLANAVINWDNKFKLISCGSNWGQQSGRERSREREKSIFRKSICSCIWLHLGPQLTALVIEIKRLSPSHENRPQLQQQSRPSITSKCAAWKYRKQNVV